MKIKRIKKVISQKAMRNVRHCDTVAMWLREVRLARIDGPEAHKRFVYQQWALTFKTEPPADVNVVLLEVKVAYKIEFDERRAKGQTLSKKFLKNYDAAMKFDVQGFNADMLFYLEMTMKYRGLTPEKEQEMKAKRKAGAVKAQATKAKNNPVKGPRKGATWHALFSENFSKKRTDAELAKEMTKRMGGGYKYTEAEVIKNRGFFNFGAFGKNLAKPKVALGQFKEE